MTSRAILIAVVFSALVVGQATAEIIDGNKLLADCQDGDNPNARESTTKWGTCFGYISGVADALVRRLVLYAGRGDGGASSRCGQTLHPESSGKAIYVCA
jgi:hypothetical protein